MCLLQPTLWQTSQRINKIVHANGSKACFPMGACRCCYYSQCFSRSVLDPCPKLHYSVPLPYCTGAGLVGYVDEWNGQSQGADSFLGDSLCVLSGCFYAAYTIAIRLMLEDDEQASMMLFFGFVGLINLFCLAPVLGLLWATAAVDPGKLTARIFGLTVAKGRARFCCDNCTPG